MAESGKQDNEDESDSADMFRVGHNQRSDERDF